MATLEPSPYNLDSCRTYMASLGATRPRATRYIEVLLVMIAAHRATATDPSGMLAGGRTAKA